MKTVKQSDATRSDWEGEEGLLGEVISSETWQEGANHGKIYGEVCSRSKNSKHPSPMGGTSLAGLMNAGLWAGDTRWGWKGRQGPLRKQQITFPLPFNWYLRRPCPTSELLWPLKGTGLPPPFHCPQVSTGFSHFQTGSLKDLYPIPPGNIIYPVKGWSNRVAI